jgi:hypothetical protein
MAANDGLAIVLAASIGLVALAGCGGGDKADPNDPTTVENSSKYEPKVGGPGIGGVPADKPK